MVTIRLTVFGIHDVKPTDCKRIIYKLIISFVSLALHFVRFAVGALRLTCACVIGADSKEIAMIRRDHMFLALCGGTTCTFRSVSMVISI